MKIISLMNDSDVIQNIPKYLGLWKQGSAPHGKKPKVPDPVPVSSMISTTAGLGMKNQS
jgi:hypothetical protein